MQNGTPPSEVPNRENSQPHIVAIERDEYFQYMIAVEQSLMLDCTEISTALFLLLATHYVFNLSYHVKAERFMTIELFFVQEVCCCNTLTLDDTSDASTEWLQIFEIFL